MGNDDETRRKGNQPNMPTAIIQSVAPVTDRKFGVEIEFVGLAADAAIRAISGVGANISGQVTYSHADSTTTWKIVPDGSLSGMNSGELVSPILSGLAGLQEVQRVVNALSEAGATVNRSCGLHVHCDAADLSGNDRLAIARRYAKFETLIDGFMPASRRGSNNHFCSSILPYANTHSTSGFPRHLKVNLTAYDRHRSVEFRHHAGTVNANKICNWIRFCVNFVERSKERTMELVGQNHQPAVSSTGGFLTRNANAPVGARALRNYRLIVETLVSTRTGSAATLARGIGVSEASIVVMVSHLRTRYGFGIRKIRWSGVYSITRMGTLPSMAIRGGRRANRGRAILGGVAAGVPVAAASNMPADALFAGLDAGTVGFYEGRIAALSSEDSCAA
jgi:hypothetical protein